MTEGNFQNPNLLGIVEVNSVFIGEDAKGRDRLAFTLGVPNGGQHAGVNQVQTLIELLKPIAEGGGKIKLDFRVTDREGQGGKKFKSAFLMVNKVIPKDAEDSTSATDQVDRVNASL